MLVSTKTEFDSLLTKINNGPAITVYDLETTGLKSFKQRKPVVETAQPNLFDADPADADPFEQDQLIGVAILIPDKTGEGRDESFYLPFRHRVGTNLPIEELQRLAPILADPERGLVGFNIKFDVHFTEAEGIPVGNYLIDVMLAAHLANENEFSFALKRLGAKHIGASANQAEKDLLDKLTRTGFKKGGMEHLKPEEVAPYAEQDVILTWQLAMFYHENLGKQGILHLWPEVNMYLRAITAMEQRGVLIDPEKSERNTEQGSSRGFRLI